MNTLYLDMDGVLADFDGYARTVIKTDVDSGTGMWAHEDWRKLRTVPNLYRNLPPMPQAHDLYNLAMRFQNELNWRVAVLTAVPKNNDIKDAFQDKFDWIAEHFPGVRIYFGPYSKDKHTHATPGDILVDDRTSNCEEWTAAGGIAVQVRKNRYQEALDTLESILNSKLQNA